MVPTVVNHSLAEYGCGADSISSRRNPDLVT